MAEIQVPVTTPQPPEADKAKARQWFKKAADCRERRDYDYAIECFITGLAIWPDAVEEGHMPLRSVSVQRQQAGGKKPGMMDSMKKSFSGKDAKQNMLNAEELMSKDPDNAKYVDGFLDAACKGGFYDTAMWFAPLALSHLKKDKKPDKNRFKGFRQSLLYAVDQAETAGGGPVVTSLLEQAVQSLDFQVVRTTGSDDLRDEQRNLSGRLTISRGKYQEAETFRDSLRDADAQKLIHDSERVKQGEQTLEALIVAAKKEWEAAPTDSAKINAYVDALQKRDTRAGHEQAIAVLVQASEQTRTYNFKSRADDIRLQLLEGTMRELKEKARAGNEDDEQQLRLARMEYTQVELEVARERVQKYPIDMRLKYKLGAALFRAGEFDEAIPVLQAATADPRSRTRCELLIGRAFYEQKIYSQSTAVLKEALDGYELTDDLSKELTYWLGRSYEAEGRTAEAKDTYGKLLRQDYNYAGGDAKRRLEALN